MMSGLTAGASFFLMAKKQMGEEWASRLNTESRRDVSDRYQSGGGEGGVGWWPGRPSVKSRNRNREG